MLLFMVEEVFLPVREVWLMPNVQWRGEVQSAEEKKGVFFFFFLVGGMLHGMWDLSSPARDQTHVPYIGSTES